MAHTDVREGSRAGLGNTDHAGAAFSNSEDRYIPCGHRRQLMKETAMLVGAVRSLTQLSSSQVESHCCLVMLTIGAALGDGGRPATRRSGTTPSASDQLIRGRFFVNVEQHSRQ